MNDQVREHIRLLAIFHYVVGGVGYLFSLIPCIHLSIGIFFLVAPEEMFEVKPPVLTPSVLEQEGASAPAVAPEAQEAPEAGGTMPPRVDASPPAGQVQPFPSKLFGAMFTVIASVIILAGLTLSTCIITAGRRLSAHRSHMFCMVMAGIECLFMPFGTVLGIFTILTLIKPEARELFGLPSLATNSAAGV